MLGDIGSAVMVWDIETVPDISTARRVYGLSDATDEDVRAALGTTFPKLIFHQIICIGALIAIRTIQGWDVKSVGAPNTSARSEKDLIKSFVGKVAELCPRLVTFNGSSFDLPVVRYRALLHQLPAPGLSCRPYFNRYTDDALDLCDVLSSYDSRGKISLDELSKALGHPGKPVDIKGHQVDEFYRSGRIEEISEYCKTDVINTYLLWLRYELFRGVLSDAELQSSERSLQNLVNAKR
jgi:predicted PolB exonuclease-like 3'-5' exonuclease